jgi:hypothetical protein
MQRRILIFGLFGLAMSRAVLGAEIILTPRVARVIASFEQNMITVLSETTHV